MEEPENGIHPKRITAMLSLVRALAGQEDATGTISDGAGLRQVLMNTHSPMLVAQLPDEALLVAETLRFKGAEFVNFKPMPGTWRAGAGAFGVNGLVSRGELEAALGRSPPGGSPRSGRPRLVEDHLRTPDLFTRA
jgi:hypothetical protein